MPLKMECRECGKVFNSDMSEALCGVKCPRCGGYNTMMVGLD